MRAALPTFYGSQFLADRRLVLRSKSGAQFAVEPRDLGTYFAMLNNGPLCPTHVLETCIKHLSDGDVMYDIGANIGFITVEIAHHFRGRVRLAAFEPQKSLANRIAVSAMLNDTPNVEVFDVLLGEAEGSTELFVASNTAHASLRPRSRDAKPTTLPVVTLDSLLEREALPPPALIKLDVEGSELSVLRGAVRTLKAHQPYLIFEADENMRRFGYTKKELFGLIRSAHDYTFYDVECDDGGHFLGVRRVEGAEASIRDDILAVPRNRPLRWPV
jgi:FkbM family methyltransferase